MRPVAAVAVLLSLLALPACQRRANDADRASPDRGAIGAADDEVSDRTYVVSPDGDDHAAGTEDAPWATVARGLEALRPGETLLLREGVYEERIRGLNLRAGRPDARITVAGYPGERAVVRGLLWLTGPSYWTIRNIGVTWGGLDSKQHLVKLVDGEGWVFEGNEVWGAKSYAGVLIAGTKDGEPSQWRFAGNCVHDTVKSNGPNQDHLVYVNTGVDAGSGAIEGNLLFGAPNGAGVKLGGPSRGEGGAASTHVAYNTIADTAQAIVVSWRAHDNAIDRNLLGPVGAKYGTIRAFELTGQGNRADDNVGFGGRSMILDDAGGSSIDGVGNRFPVDPAFTATGSCHGYVPTNPEVTGVGHTAAALPPEAQRP